MRRQTGSRHLRMFLVSVYITQGYEAAKPLAIKHGYKPRYLNRMAAEMLGHSRTIYYSRNPLVQDAAYRFDPRFATPINISDAEAMSA